MNRLEAALRNVMRECHIADLAGVASRIGITQSQLSKILLGKVGLTPKTLRKLVTGISGDVEHRFDILRAHLYDEAERSGFPAALLVIELRNKEENAVSFADVPRELQDQLRDIADQITGGDEDLSDGIRWIATTIQNARRMGAAHFGEPLVAEKQAKFQGKPDSAHGPLSSPTDEVIAEQSKKHTAEPEASRAATSTPPRSHPTVPPRAKK
jgi:transcriptional regulator with XRE-family HTH domain